MKFHRLSDLNRFYLYLLLCSETENKMYVTVFALNTSACIQQLFFLVWNRSKLNHSSSAFEKKNTVTLNAIDLQIVTHEVSHVPVIKMVSCYETIKCNLKLSIFNFAMMYKIMQHCEPIKVISGTCNSW